MHGELLKVQCTLTGKIYHYKTDVNEETLCECCSLPNTLRPHIVWFGEVPIKLDNIYAKLSQADIFISIGTSGFVYPAAGFRDYAKKHGAHTVELNLEETALSSSFDEAYHGLASDIVPQFLNRYHQSINNTMLNQ